MKEKLYTIEVNDALNASDECLFCFLERKIEQENLEFVLGSSYMEKDVREETSKKGFCRQHTKMMYDYGNALGNAWILKSRLEYMRRELAERERTALGEAAAVHESAVVRETAAVHESIAVRETAVSGGRQRVREKTAASGKPKLGFGWLPGLTGHRKKDVSSSSETDSCYLCQRIDGVRGRMLDSFFWLLAHDPDFEKRLLASKGFCFPHFAEVEGACGERFASPEREVVLGKLYGVMAENLQRVQGDIDWFIEKYDHGNRDADWKQSRDAVPRTMQKLAGGYPADPVFRNRK